jgi:hypothetical protein
MPQQSLALVNSDITIAQSKVLAKTLSASVGESDEAFARAAFSQVLGRPPRDEEIATCRDFLAQAKRARPQAPTRPPRVQSKQPRQPRQARALARTSSSSCSITTTS